jgi:hypothetical protein
MPKPGKTRRFTAEDIEQRLSANKSLRDQNPGLSGGVNMAAAVASSPASTALTPKTGQDSAPAKKKGKRKGEMNGTEAEFARMLQKQVDNDQINEFAYESITLNWGEGKKRMKYTPDFVCVMGTRTARTMGIPSKTITFVRTKLIEVKGAHIYEKDRVKFKAAATHFADLYEFEFWQKKEGEWKQLI